jgi:hypothetical protein
MSFWRAFGGVVRQAGQALDGLGSTLQGSLAIKETGMLINPCTTSSMYLSVTRLSAKRVLCVESELYWIYFTLVCNPCSRVSAP